MHPCVFNHLEIYLRNHSTPRCVITDLGGTRKIASEICMSKQNASNQRGHIPTGKKFMRLVVVERAGSDDAGRAMFLCRCKCGNECRVRGADLRSGHTKSCGCWRSGAAKKRFPMGQVCGTTGIFHRIEEEWRAEAGEQAQSKKVRAKTGTWLVVCRFCGRCLEATLRQLREASIRCECLTETYNSWKSLRDRCTNKNHKQYKDYGGRGISVCERWKDSFVNFVQDMGRRPEGKTIHRKDNDGNYEPRNCVWATDLEQAQGRRKRGS